ncbi:MAG TPA: hypothetical protein VGQ55_17275, partial [Pyrinomonadaceae bacterium]|nr:hypothetical protein [Pyrinomonadaceae bacterium]
IIFAITIVLTALPTFADWKLTQKVKMGEGASQSTTIYSKGVRQRRETKMDLGAEAGDPDVQAMMAQMGMSMPAFPVHVSQCDLKQDIYLNDKQRSVFIDYYDWSTLPPEKLARRPNQKVVIKGTVTTDSYFVDSGKRQQMFGLTARWVKHTMTVETSADSCDGASSMKIEQEGWFVILSLDREACPIERPPGGKGGCRPKVIIKRAQNPGVMLTGTTRMYQGSKVAATSEIETLELSKATLDQALFDVPKDWTEVDSYDELMNMRGRIDTSAKTVFNDGSAKGKAVKTVAIDFFSGNASKLNQDELRGYISAKLTSAGLSGFAVNSQADIAGGNFANVIGVEIKKVKESGASKIGGLFGKVTGGDDLAKVGNSQAEIVVTVYGNDGKTVVASSPARADVKGKGDDAVKAALDQVLDGLLAKIK